MIFLYGGLVYKLNQAPRTYAPALSTTKPFVNPFVNPARQSSARLARRGVTTLVVDATPSWPDGDRTTIFYVVIADSPTSSSAPSTTTTGRSIFRSDFGYASLRKKTVMCSGYLLYMAKIALADTTGALKPTVVFRRCTASNTIVRIR